MDRQEVLLDNGSQVVALISKGRTKEEILALTKKIASQNAEMMLWRLDYFEHVTEMNYLLELAKQVRASLRGIPLLITFRTQGQGGNTELGSEDAYLNLVKIVINFSLGDAIDIEMSHTQDRIQSLIEDAHNKGMKVVIN
ncbi:3-dehydroquinate dehydratase-1 [Lactobacillus colini]|uniref:3-dehydroquinate dehydratase-1 n=1 Tax=Lactobacillus colini TaxID=1819254 RepID=A0ABS4MER7_9LACO|nr:type I 3-dehydroquinate dehydratase [Lactobacillus colini]MBP2058177.1 3-dehydroquinate dehydratase-1 [Lactobacillus colini]